MRCVLVLSFILCLFFFVLGYGNISQSITLKQSKRNETKDKVSHNRYAKHLSLCIVSFYNQPTWLRLNVN